MPSIAPVSTRSWRFARVARLAVLVGCGVAVAGCTGAVETFRSLKGSNRNDPDPVVAPFTGNMAAAEAAPYPNLASVPPPPSRATTAVERRKLTETLIAERAAAAQAAAGAPATAAPTPATAAASGTVLTPSPAPARLAATAQPMLARSAVEGDMPGPRGGTAEPSQALPRDSELRMPQVRSLPEPDEPRSAPPPVRLPPVRSPAPPSQLPPAAVASTAPQPPPPVPQLVPIAPPSVPDLAKTEPSRTPAAITVAMLDAFDAGQIAQVASRYKDRLDSQPPRAVRVIAYTAPPPPGADPLGFYHDALERAQGIAKALSEAGIPAKMIQTEAKPAAGPIAAARVEIQFLP